MRFLLLRFDSRRLIIVKKKKEKKKKKIRRKKTGKKTEENAKFYDTNALMTAVVVKKNGTRLKHHARTRDWTRKTSRVAETTRDKHTKKYHTVRIQTAVRGHAPPDSSPTAQAFSSIIILYRVTTPRPLPGTVPKWTYSSTDVRRLLKYYFRPTCRCRRWKSRWCPGSISKRFDRQGGGRGRSLPRQRPVRVF